MVFYPTELTKAIKGKCQGSVNRGQEGGLPSVGWHRGFDAIRAGAGLAFLTSNFGHLNFGIEASAYSTKPTTTMRFPFKIPEQREFDAVGFGLNAVDHLIVVPEYPAFDTKMRLLEHKQSAG